MSNQSSKSGQRRLLDTIFKAAADRVTPPLFVAAQDYAVEILKKAKNAELIDSYHKKKAKEDLVKPEKLFYIKAVESAWRYAHTKKGGVRTAERAQADYHMRVAQQKDGSVLIQFTTSQFASVAKKLPGFSGGRADFVARDVGELDLKFNASSAFASAVASFLYIHADLLRNKTDREKASVAHRESFPRNDI